MKRIDLFKLILAFGISFSFGAVCIAQEWGTVMYTRNKVSLRKERSAKAPVKGQLKKNQAVKADFLKGGWYAVFPLNAKERNEKKALGYVHRQHLRARAPDPATATPAGEEKAETAPAALPREPDVEIRNVRYSLNDNGKETLFITFNRFYTPAIITLEGDNPRIALDIENVSSFDDQQAAIEVAGKYITRIRSSMDYQGRKARIVLDLEPRKDYYVQPAFIESENLFSLQVSIEDKKREP